MTTGQHVLRFPGTLQGFSEAAGTLRGFLDARHVDGEPRYNVELAFDEIVTNIVRHGSPTGEIEVAIDAGSDELVLTFDDDGVPFDPCAHTAPAATDEVRVGGLGLMLVRSISTGMTYERTPQNHNRLTLVMPAR